MALTSQECAELLGVLQGRAVGHRYSEMARWLRRSDFEPPKKPKGSHRVWRHPSGRRVGVVDSGGGDMLPAYVKQAIRTMREANQCPE